MFDIKNRRLELGLTLEEIGEAVGVGKSTVRKWEQGMIENMKRDKIAALSKVLQVSPLAFIKEDYEIEKDNITYIFDKLDKPRQRKVYTYSEQQLEEQNKVIHIHKDNGDYVTETLRGYLSAGTGEMQLDEVIEEVEIPVEMIPNQHYDMLLQVNGDSMLPMFQDGERIFVRKISEPSELRSGQIGVFIIDGESFLKKAYKEDNQLRLVSLNDKYEDLIFNEVNDIEVVGTVVM